MAADFYQPFIGGAERQSELLSRELVQRGYEVHLVTTWHKGLPAVEQRAGVTVHRLKALSTLVPWFSADPNRRFHPPMPDPLMVWNLRRLLRRIKPDVIHAYGWIAYSCGASVLGTKIPMLISVRDYGYICATRGLLYRGRECSGPELAKCLRCATDRYGAAKGIAAVGGVFLGRPLLLRHVTGIHAISRYVQRVTRRDLLRSDTDASEAMALVPDFVIPSFLEQLPVGDTAFVDQLPKGPFILFVGALQAHKGIYELVAAYKKLRNAPHLVVIGSRWPDTPTKFPPGISVFHNVDHASVMASWERCLFGVVPSRMPEPLGVVALEAMSRGKAVVGSDTGGIPDMVVDGETGLLFPPGNVEAMRAAMQRLIDDPALRQRLGEAAFERVTTFTAEAVMPAYEELYRRATTTAADS